MSAELGGVDPTTAARGQPDETLVASAASTGGGVVAGIELRIEKRKDGSRLGLTLRSKDGVVEVQDVVAGSAAAAAGLAAGQRLLSVDGATVGTSDEASARLSAALAQAVGPVSVRVRAAAAAGASAAVPPLKLSKRGSSGASLGEPSPASASSPRASPRAVFGAAVGRFSSGAIERLRSARGSSGRSSADSPRTASPQTVTPRGDGPLIGEFKVRGGVTGRQLHSRTFVYEPKTKALLYYASAADAAAGAYKAKGARKVVSVARGDPFKDEGLHLTFACQEDEGTDGGADVVAIALDAKECARWLSVVNAS
tara:strand:- start:1 stop:936 length:936 start_codon:yes stop_codon:yes gene_type:complete